ncbi:MAG: HAMP domain-containing protein [Candidatus Riflebacteria bacterium]|nr:HAMP domain-containing protein [Candidatus Riflebacteria bacterium]
MRKNLVVLLLLFFCLAFPFLTIWGGDHEQEKLQAYEGFESARKNVLSQLNQIILEHSHETQMTKLCELFWKNARGSIASYSNLSEVEPYYRQLFVSRLPAHDFVLVDLAKSENLFASGSLHEFSKFYADFVKIATGTLSKDEKAETIKQIKNGMQVCFPASVQAEWQGKWQILRGLTRTRVLYWTIFDNRFFVAVYLDGDHVSNNFVAEIQALTWKNRDTGLFFLPASSETAVFSPYFSVHNELKDLFARMASSPDSLRRLDVADLSDQINKPGFQLTSFNNAVIGAAPVTLSANYRAYLLQQLKPVKMLDRSSMVFKYCVFLMLFAVWLWQLVCQIRNPDCREFSVRFLLLATFLACAILPLSCMNFLSGKFLVERYKNQKFSLTDCLHKDLKTIDDNGRHNLASHTAYIKSLNTIEKFEKVSGQQFSNDTRSKFFNQCLSLLAEQKMLFMHLFLIISSKGDHTHLIGYYNKFNENTKKDFIVSRIIQNARQRFKRFRPCADKMDNAPVGGNQLDIGGLEKEMVDDIFLRLIGPGTYVDLFHYPERLFEIGFMFTSTYILESIVKSGKEMFLTYWFWSATNLEGKYLKESLPAFSENVSATSAQDISVGLIGFRNEMFFYPETFSLQKGLYPELYDIMMNSHLTRTSVRIEGETNGERLLYEAMPATNIKAVLAGQKSLTALENEKVHGEQMEAFALTVLLIFALGIGMACSMYFIAPLQQIIAAIKTIKAGNLGVRLDELRHDEFGSLGFAFNKMAKGLEEGSVLRQYVSKSARQVARSDEHSEAAGRGKNITVTILFSSLKDFLQFQCSHESSEVFAVMNRHLEIANMATEEHGGEIDKIIGDKIMLVFRHEEMGGDLAAVSSALKVIRHMNELACRQSFELNLSMGLSTGKVISGVVGVGHGHLDFTVIGDAVNLAARLASLAGKDDGSSVLVSSITQAFASGENGLVRWGTTKVKGKNQEVEIFSLRA